MKVLFKSLISDLQNQLKKEFEKTDLPEQRLRNVLLLSTKLIYKNRNVAASIMKDVNFHDKFYMKLMKETHISLINFYREIIDDCKTSGVLDKRIDTNILFAVMSGSVATFSKNVFFENYNDKEFEKKINLILDLLMEKFK
jgi:hypothetical protein